MRLQAWFAQELPLHMRSQDLGHCFCDGNRGDLRPLTLDHFCSQRDRTAGTECSYWLSLAGAYKILAQHWEHHWYRVFPNGNSDWED